MVWMSSDARYFYSAHVQLKANRRQKSSVILSLNSQQETYLQGLWLRLVCLFCRAVTEQYWLNFFSGKRSARSCGRHSASPQQFINYWDSRCKDAEELPILQTRLPPDGWYFLFLFIPSLLKWRKVEMDCGVLVFSWLFTVNVPFGWSWP